MSKNVRNGIIAFAVIFFGSGILALLGVDGFTRTAISMGFGSAIYFVLANLSSTKAETRASEADRLAALAGTPPPGSALLYVSRTGYVGKLVGIDFLLDGVNFAQLRSPRFTALVIHPGAHTLSAVNSSAVSSLTSPGVAEFVAAPGEVIVYELAIPLAAMKSTYKLTRQPAAALSALNGVPMVVSALAGPLQTGQTAMGTFASTPPPPPMRS